MSHPEQRSDEVWLTNIMRGTTLETSWKTTRVGNYAYDSDGELFIDGSPVFVTLAELRETLTDKKVSVFIELADKHHSRVQVSK